MYFPSFLAKAFRQMVWKHVNLSSVRCEKCTNLALLRFRHTTTWNIKKVPIVDKFSCTSLIVCRLCKTRVHWTSVQKREEKSRFLYMHWFHTDLAKATQSIIRYSVILSFSNSPLNFQQNLILKSDNGHFETTAQISRLPSLICPWQ